MEAPAGASGVHRSVVVIIVVVAVMMVVVMMVLLGAAFEIARHVDVAGALVVRELGIGAQRPRAARKRRPAAGAVPRMLSGARPFSTQSTTGKNASITLVPGPPPQ